MLDSPVKSSQENIFVYDEYKLSTKSCYKPTSVNSNEHTKSFKFFTKEKDYMKNVKRQVKYIISQGTDKNYAQK